MTKCSSRNRVCGGRRAGRGSAVLNTCVDIPSVRSLHGRRCLAQAFAVRPSHIGDFGGMRQVERHLLFNLVAAEELCRSRALVDTESAGDRLDDGNSHGRIYAAA
jgi:hypothetical protein